MLNKISDEIKKLRTFNNSLTAYNKDKSSTGVAQLALTQTKKLQGRLQLVLTPETPLGPMPV